MPMTFSNKRYWHRGVIRKQPLKKHETEEYIETPPKVFLQEASLTS